MKAIGGKEHEVVVPVGVFTTLRRELEKECGTLPAVRAMHHAGFEAGTEAAESFRNARRERLDELAAKTFWSEVARFLTDRGWGTLVHESPHRGFGILRSDNWSEAATSVLDPEGSCAFTTGYLTGFLTSCAGVPLAVLEATCRSRGDDACRFAFGSEAAVHELYDRLLNGADLGRAFSEL